MRDLFTYGSLMFAGLGFAYWSTLPSEASLEGQTPIYSVKSDEIVSMDLKMQDKLVSVQKDAQGKFWINYKQKATSENKEDQKKETDSPDVAASGETWNEEYFLANNKLDGLIAQLKPLHALRVVGQKEDVKLSDFGLDTAQETFQVTKKDGSKFSLLLGKKSYGSRNRFGVESDKNRVVIFSFKELENLERANFRLYERKISKHEDEDFENAVLMANGQNAARKLEHTQRDQSGKLQWLVAGTKDKPKPLYTTFMGKIFKLRIQEFAKDAGKISQLAELKPFLEISLTGKGSTDEQMQFIKSEDNGSTNYWVKSKYLGTFARLSNNKMAAIEKDIPSIFE